MVDLSENFCDREREFLLAIKEQCKVSCVKKNQADLLGSQYLFEVLKAGYFEKCLPWRAPLFFQNEGEI